jgi:hypothetical protein
MIKRSLITDPAGQESPQRQVEFPKILAIVPFIRVTGYRRSESGVAQVNIQCDTWVDQEYLEKIDSTLARLEEKMRIIDEDLYGLSVPNHGDEAMAKCPRTSVRVCSSYEYLQMVMN